MTAAILACLILLLGFACMGLLSYGMTLAHFQREWPTVAATSVDDDIRFAIFMGLLGPFGFLPVFCMTSFAKHGVMFNPHKDNNT